jgi:hypothetical protein
LNLERRVVVHNPLGNGLPDSRAVGNHQVKSETFAVIAGLVGVAPDGVNFAGELFEDFVAVADDVGFALAGGDGGVVGSPSAA